MDTQLESKWIEGFEGLYSIREDGAVRSHDRFVPHGNSQKLIKGRWLKAGKDSDGYLIVSLGKLGKFTTYKVHRLVASAFIPNPDNLPEVNHIDEDKANPHKSNLEWCTTAYNIDYSHSKTYKFKSPDGCIVEVRNLSKFCKDNNLTRQNMYQLKEGYSHKGWTKC